MVTRRNSNISEKETSISRKDYTSSQGTAAILQGLEDIPSDWVLTPVDGSKRPYRSNWQNEAPIKRQDLAKAVKSGNAKGYGLRTGKWSNGILAVDADGNAAHALLSQLGGLPRTVSFTSGKPGRCQYLVRVPQEYWSVIETKKINTGVKGEDGKDQLLELRWNGCQSVLPPSVHPETGSYKWVNSPQDCEIAECPIWIIEYFLNKPTPTTPTLLTDDIPLYLCLTKADRDLIDHGVSEGGRNDSGAKLARNLIGTSKRLTHLGYRYSGDAIQIFNDYCSRCSPPLSSSETNSIWRGAEKSNPTSTLDDIALENCIKSWRRKQTLTPVQKEISVQNGIVRADNSELSAGVRTVEMIGEQDIQRIVCTVCTVLDSPESEHIKSIKLSQLSNKLLNEGIPKSVFDSILAEAKAKTAILPEDDQQLDHLVNLGNASINWKATLPPALARDIIHDAELLCVDPIVLFNSLLAAVASLGGTKTPLDMQTHEIKCNIWAITVLESGGGKSRADNVIFAPLRELQATEDENFKRLSKEYQKDSSGTPPRLRKYVFEVSTIQAVLRRLAESPGHSSVWARDEIAGLFNSLGQHSKGKDSEDQQILLKLWDGSGFSVDRVSLSDSYSCQASALSISGGIQPGVFRKIFADPEDANGLQARPLYAVPKRLKLQRKKGFVHLSERLPLLYDFVKNLPRTVVNISEFADTLYSKIVDDNEDLLETITSASLRTWMCKYPTQVLKIALILHLIECFYSPSKEIELLTEDTLKRALHLGEYYKASFQFLQEKVSNSDDISTTLLQVLDKAKQSPKGISTRDVYKPSRSIQGQAKSLGLESGVYVEGLFNQLVEMGYGQIVRSGKAVKFTATSFEDTLKGADSADSADNSSESLTLTTPEKYGSADNSADSSADNSILHGGHVETDDKSIPRIKSKNNPMFQIGDRVNYIGTQYTGLTGMDLVVTKIEGYLVTCTKPDGYLTTGIDCSDIKSVVLSEEDIDF